MKRHVRLLAASCVVALSLPSFADMMVKVTGPDNAVSDVPLTMGTKIAFRQSGVSISNDCADPVVFPYSDVQAISFGEGSGVRMLQTRNSLSLRQNPVYSHLEVAGHDGKPADLAVTSMSGVRVLNVRGWNGEDVDVSALPAGIYILNINNNNIKFVKK